MTQADERCHRAEAQQEAADLMTREGLERRIKALFLEERAAGTDANWKLSMLSCARSESS